MTAITLPTYPQPDDEVEFELMDRSGQTSPAVGGKIQLKRRVGDRFRLTVTLPPMRHSDARAWIAARLNSVTTGATVVWGVPLAEGEGTSVGTPLVNGASQTGSTLNLKGLTVGLVIPALTPLSFVVGSRYYLYFTRASATVNGSGNVALPISPLLRASPANNAAVDFVTPKIEGLFEGAVSWTLVQLCNIGLTFTLFENE